MIRMRKNCPEFGWGNWELIHTNLPQVFAHRCEWRGGEVIAIHNLAAEACTATLDVNAEESRHLCDLFGDRLYEPFSDGAHRISLEGYGYRWFRLLRERCDSR
jgi:maltose alpha-D-glucosyltransferase/alpha-amylase